MPYYEQIHEGFGMSYVEYIYDPEPEEVEELEEGIEPEEAENSDEQEAIQWEEF